MSEDEFWQSTAVRVHELGEVNEKYDKRRDYFIACLWAVQTKESSPDDLLNVYYHKESVTVTVSDPEDGASIR